MSKPSIRIELTPEQQKQVKDASGEEVTFVEFSIQELEERVAPLRGIK